MKVAIDRCHLKTLPGIDDGWQRTENKIAVND